jgi:hypothetical protein
MRHGRKTENVLCDKSGILQISTQRLQRNERGKITKQITRVPKHGNACCDKDNVSYYHLVACCAKGENHLQRICIFGEISRKSSKTGLYNKFEIVSIQTMSVTALQEKRSIKKAEK